METEFLAARFLGKMRSAAAQSDPSPSTAESGRENWARMAAHSWRCAPWNTAGGAVAGARNASPGARDRHLAGGASGRRREHGAAEQERTRRRDFTGKAVTSGGASVSRGRMKHQPRRAVEIADEH
jgi:hypothetical protein